jgi:hypothetical protein
MTINSLLALAAAFAMQADPMLAPVQGADWEPIAEDVDGRYFIDPASLRRAGDLAYFRIRAEARPGGISGTYTALFGIVMNCATRTSGYESGQLFDAEGRPFHERQFAPGEVEFRPIRAGSSEDQIYPRVCAARGR